MQSKFKSRIAVFVSVVLVSLGFAPASYAGMVGTEYAIDQDARAASIARLEVLLAREDVAEQLSSFGVDAAHVMERVHGLSDEEVLALEGRIDAQVAGSDAVSAIGITFLVLIILELLGVTDVFKAL